MSHSLVSLFENALNDKKIVEKGCILRKQDRMAKGAMWRCIPLRHELSNSSAHFRFNPLTTLWRISGTINQANVRMKASGKYQAITVKYFPGVAQS